MCVCFLLSKSVIHYINLCFQLHNDNIQYYLNIKCITFIIYTDIILYWCLTSISSRYMEDKRKNIYFHIEYVYIYTRLHAFYRTKPLEYILFMIISVMVLFFKSGVEENNVIIKH